MPELILKKWTKRADILLWGCGQGEQVSIRLFRDASFELYAEATFIAVLQALRMRAGSIQVYLNFDINAALEAPGIDSRWPDFLNGLAGAALVQSADRIIAPSGEDITHRLLDIAWGERIVKRDGVIGDGKKQSIVCRNPGTPVPRCLRDGIKVTIPTRLKFERLLRKLGKELGAGTMFSANRFLDTFTEDELSGFLFEAFRNAIEHRPENCLPGVWGVTIEKLVFSSDSEIKSRGQVPQILQSYLECSWKGRRRSTGMFMLCVTVCDYGPGIQNTLPPLEGESDWDRLLRAFRRGVSRKAKSGSPDWGQGLPNILDTAKALKALLFVRSAGEAAVADGGSSDPKWTKLSGPGVTATHVAGTSLSVTWVLSNENPDQATFEF